MKLISDCKGAWRHYSTLALTIAGSLQGAWLTIPDSIKSDLPHWLAQTVAWVVFLVAVGGLGGKFVDQSKPEDKA